MVLTSINVLNFIDMVHMVCKQLVNLGTRVLHITHFTYSNAWLLSEFSITDISEGLNL